ncbi:MAG: GFA family protein [Verrucomicrobiae bacterium]|nr:GFA family protein [Verrucomicrobiae bacterium]
MIHGRCLCGAVRYAIDAQPRGTSYCHCEDCRRASGAPVVAWTFFPAGSLSWTHGKPKLLHFANRERTFCGDCGTPISFFDPAIPEIFEVTTCSLDEPDAMQPDDHNWVCDQLPWFATADEIPRYAHYPDTP